MYPAGIIVEIRDCFFILCLSKMIDSNATSIRNSLKSVAESSLATLTCSNLMPTSYSWYSAQVTSKHWNLFPSSFNPSINLPFRWKENQWHTFQNCLFRPALTTENLSMLLEYARFANYARLSRDYNWEDRNPPKATQSCYNTSCLITGFHS